MEIKRIIAIVLLVALTIITISGCGKQSSSEVSQTGSEQKEQEVIHLRIGHDQAETHGYHLGSLYFAEKVKEATNGRVQISVFPNAQLGNELTMLDSLRLGDLDFCISAAPNASTHVPGLGFFSLSYLFDDKEHFIKTMTDPEFISIVQEKVAARNIGFRPIGFLTAGLRSLYNNKRPVVTVEDAKGLKMRVMASPVESSVWQALGTMPTSIPFGEIYTAMQTGLIDAAEGAPSSYVTAKHHEVAKYLSLTQHQWLVSVLWVSEETWSKLPEDVKEVLTDVARQMTEYEINLNAEEDEKVVKDAESLGIKVNEVDRAAFKKVIEPLQDEVTKELEMEDALQRIRDLAK